MNCPHCGYPSEGVSIPGRPCDGCGRLESGAYASWMRIYSRAAEGTADNYSSVRPECFDQPFNGLIRARIANERGSAGYGLGDLHAECSIMLDSLELRCLCAFSSPRLAIPLLAAYGGVEICGVHPARIEEIRFLGEVKMSDGRAEVMVDGRRVPLMSVEVAIEPNAAVEAVITSDFELREEWPPDLCRHLLTAMGYEWRAVRQWR